MIHVTFLCCFFSFAVLYEAFNTTMERELWSCYLIRRSLYVAKLLSKPCTITLHQFLVVLRLWVILMFVKFNSIQFSFFASDILFSYTPDSLWKIWLVESIQSIHNSLWTWHDKCNICCRYIDYYMLRAWYRFYSRVFNTISRTCELTSEWAVWY